MQSCYSDTSRVSPCKPDVEDGADCTTQIVGSNSSCKSKCSIRQLPKEQSAEYKCLASFKAHTGPVFSLCICGDLFYNGSDSSQIVAWRRADFTEFSRFGNGDGAAKTIINIKNRVFSSHQDHRIRVCRPSSSHPTSHKLSHTLPTAKDLIFRVLQPKGFVQVRRHKLCVWIQHFDTISCLATDHDFSMLYSVSWDRTLKIWRISDFMCVESIHVHGDAVNCVAVAKDGLVYTGSADKKVKVWQKGKKEHVLFATLQHKSAVNALAMSHKEEFLYSGTSEGLIKVWKTGSLKECSASENLKGHQHAVLCLASMDGILCSGSADKSVRVWRLVEGKGHACIAILEGLRSTVKSLAITMNIAGNCLVYSGGLNGHIQAWCISLALKNKNPVPTNDMLKP